MHMDAYLLARIICALLWPAVFRRTAIAPSVAHRAITNISDTTSAPPSAHPLSKITQGSAPPVLSDQRAALVRTGHAHLKSGPRLRLWLPSARHQQPREVFSSSRAGSSSRAPPLPTSSSFQGDGRFEPRTVEHKDASMQQQHAPARQAPNVRAGASALRDFVGRALETARRQQLSLSKYFSKTTAIRRALGITATLLPIVGALALWLWIDAEEHAMQLS